MSVRRITWIIHNILVTPFIPLRLIVLLMIWMGEAAEWVGWRLPGWRRYDSWSYGYKDTPNEVSQ